MKDLESYFEMLKESTMRVQEKYKSYLEEEKKVAKILEVRPEIIYFLVGGQQFSISKQIITEFPESLFYCLIGSDRWSPNEDGYFVFDRSPRYFALVMDFMRFKDKELVLTGLSSGEKNILKAELEYFQLMNTSSKQPSFSNLIDSEMEDYLLLWLDHRELELLYRASDDGFVASSFHSKCNGKGACLVIVKSTDGNIFGGYTSVGWKGGIMNYVPDSQSWIFTLVNKNNILPTKYNVSMQEYGIYDRDDYGPTFGGGHDLNIANNSNVNTTSYTNFPHSYTDTTGKGKGTLTSYNFQCEEIEVFHVI